MAQCNICGSEKVVRPAGVSKATGKPYDSFMACPNYMNHPKGTSQAVAQQGMAQQQTNAVDAKWEKIRDEKREDIKWMNALNNACLLLAHGQSLGFKKLQEMADFIYEMEYTGKRKVDYTTMTNSTPSLPTNRFDFQKEPQEANPLNSRLEDQTFGMTDFESEPPPFN